MSKHKKKRPRTKRQPQENDLPNWIAEEGNLNWRGDLVMHLAVQAHTERAILDKFEECKWRFVVKNPLSRGKSRMADPTARRRNAICNLMRHQGGCPVIQFASFLDGFIAWCPVEWLVE